MDTKNIIAAISLSAAVIIIYGLFFAPSPEQLNQKQLVNEKQKILQRYKVQNSEIQTIINQYKK